MPGWAVKKVLYMYSLPHSIVFGAVRVLFPIRRRGARYLGIEYVTLFSLFGWTSTNFLGGMLKKTYIAQKNKVGHVRLHDCRPRLARAATYTRRHTHLVNNIFFNTPHRYYCIRKYSGLCEPSRLLPIPATFPWCIIY